MTAAQLPATTEGIERLGQWWHPVKMGMEHALAFSPDALHVLVGVGLQLVLARLLKSTVARVSPWLGVLALELLNEWSDLTFEIWPNRPMQWGESVKDVLLTMVLPTLLLVISRWCPGILREPYGPALDSPETRAILGEPASAADADVPPDAFAQSETARPQLRETSRRPERQPDLDPATAPSARSGKAVRLDLRN